jgi:hypothetical protein
MKQYVIDQLQEQDTEALESYLTRQFGPPALERVYWILLDPEYYTTLQAAHESCHPLYFALQLKPGAFVGELLVRTHSRMHCDCMAYANEAQRNWLIALMDSIVQQLDISV